MTKADHKKEHEEFILDFIAGDAGTARSVRQLLEECPACREFFQQHAFLIDILDSEAYKEALRNLEPGKQPFRDLAALIGTGLREFADAVFTRTLALTEPLALAALSPLAVERAAAASGAGFEKDVKSESPFFDIELSTFGERLTIKLRSKSPAYDHSLVRFELLEEDSLLFADVILVTDGKGQYETGVNAVPPPEKEKLRIKLKPVHTVDLFASLEKELTVQIVTRLLSADDAEVRRSSARLLSWARTAPALEVLGKLVDDPDEQVRELARKATTGRAE